MTASTQRRHHPTDTSCNQELQKGKASPLGVTNRAVRLTWQRKEGKYLERDHTQLSKSILHPNDTDQNLLRHIGGPEQNEAHLDMK